MKNILILLLGICLASTALRAQDIGKTTLFNENWKFTKGDIPGANTADFDDTNWRQLDLPHDWSIEGPFSNEWASGTGYLPGGIGWYRKIFTPAALPASGRAYIYFDGVYKNSEVWINGQYLGKRPNGFIPFQYDLTAYLKPGKNTIAVKVDHSKFGDSRFYTGSGIYRNVYFITREPVHIPKWGVAFTTPVVSAQKAVADLKVSVANTLAGSAKITVESKLSLGNKTVASAKNDITVAGNTVAEATLSMSVAQPKLWSVDQPQLYTLSVTVLSNGKKTDVYQEQVGFRSIRFDVDAGFFLNEQNMKLKGVCLHHDAGALGAAVPREVWERRLKKLKEIGCNAIRMSHYPHQDYMYELCDELGFLVMDEAFDEWEEPKNKWIAGWNVGKPGRDISHEGFKEWALRDVKDMVLRNRNHPSIIMWSIGNEIDYPNDPYSDEVLNTGRNPQIYGKGYLADHPKASRLAELSKILVQAVKEEDTSRPVTAALAGVVMSNTTSYPENLDLVGYNYQEYRYDEDHKKYPKRIIYGSENGKDVDAWIAVDTSRNIFGQFLWTAFDFIGEARVWPMRSSGAGLMDLAAFPKNDYYQRAALWQGKPVVFLNAGKMVTGQSGRNSFGGKASWNWQQGDKIRVNCISNADEAELFLNNRSLGRISKKNLAGRLYWEADFEPGELVVKTYKDGKSWGSHTLKTAGKVSALVATSDIRTFRKNQKTLAHIELELRDESGNLVIEGNSAITVDIAGPAKLLGLESGDLASHEDYRSATRNTYNGKLLAYVQLSGKAEPVTLKLSSPGLKPVIISIRPAP